MAAKAKGSLKTKAAPQSAAAASEGVAAPCAKKITKNQSGAFPVRKTDLQKLWRSLRASGSERKKDHSKLRRRLRAQRQRAKVSQPRVQKGSLETKAAP